jgi:hypothetical protein
MPFDRPAPVTAPVEVCESVGQRIDVTVGRSSSDFIHAFWARDTAIPAMACNSVPVAQSQFADELGSRLELARQRVFAEGVHLDAVERVAADYRRGGQVRLRLIR